MQKIKELLTIAPAGALILAVLYLQGYWGAFGVRPFPFLGIQELIAHSATPFFGFFVFSLIGVFFLTIFELRSAGSEDKSLKNERKAFYISAAVITLIFLSLAIFCDGPERWIYAPVSFLCAAAPLTARKLATSQLSPKGMVVAYAIFCLIAFSMLTFCVGRTDAEKILRLKTPTVEVVLDTSIEHYYDLGKLGGNYFFLNEEKNLIWLPEGRVKQITKLLVK